MYMVVTDDYSYSGHWNDAMLEIQDDGETKNIRRHDETIGEYEIAANLHNQCSSRDAMDIDLYEIDSEDNLVCMQMKRKFEKTEGGFKPSKTDIKFIFNQGGTTD